MLSQETPFVFLFSILATGTLSSVIIQTFYKKANNQLFLLLMAGMISGTMFTSISSFLQVIMDPNEYDLLQGRLFASFSNVNDSRIECYGLGCSKCKKFRPIGFNDPEELSFLAVFIIGDCYCFSRTIRLFRICRGNDCLSVISNI